MTRLIGLRRLSLVTAIILFSMPGAQSQTSAGPDIQSCSMLKSEDERFRCFKHLSNRLDTLKGVSTLNSGWKLVRTPAPHGGADIVSITHASDSARSDLPIAGLMLRCGDLRIEVMVVMLGYAAHGATPKVAIDNNQFEASVIQGGELLLLPRRASELANSQWQSVSELSVKIELQTKPALGVVPIAGLAEAMRTLTKTCASK